jgi:aminoacyl tRNA synthase complex-interacting multifunctional protein 1
MEILTLPGDQNCTLNFIYSFISHHTPFSVLITAISHPFAPATEYPFINGKPIQSTNAAAAHIVTNSPISSLLPIGDLSAVSSTPEALNTKLAGSTFISGHFVTLADLLAFYFSRQFLATAETLATLPHFVRWCDHVQHLEGVPNNVKVPIDVVSLTAVAVKAGKAAAAKADRAKPAEAAELLNAPKPARAKAETVASTGAVKAEASGKKPAKAAGGAAAAERALDDFSRLSIIVGHITRVWPHPEADRLWCEEIDCGPVLGKRQIASGLREHYKAEDMEGRKVLVLANLKARALRGFESHGMVLCAAAPKDAAAAGGVTEIVEFLEVPASANPGDRVTVEGIEGEADGVLNAKKNPLDVLALDMATNDEKVACFRSREWKVGGGVVTVKSLKKAVIR